MSNVMPKLKDPLFIFSYSVMASYNFVNGYALLSYLEYPIIIIQQYVLIYLVLFYQNLIGSKAVAGALTYTLIVTSFLTKFIPSTILLFIVVRLKRKLHVEKINCLYA